MRDGVLDEQGQESKGQKPPCFLCQSQPQIVQTRVSRFEAPCGPPRSWVAPYTSRAVKRGVGLRVACCGQMLERIQNWIHKETKNQSSAHLSLFRPVFGAMQAFDFTAG